MATFMNMPKIGVNMTDGTVTEWYVKEGDTVTFGEMALNAETDKDIQDIPADQSGTVLKIIAQVGDNVECHKPLAIVGKPGENIDALLAQLTGASADHKQATIEAKQETKTDTLKATTVAGRIPVSPLAKKIAKDKGIDLADVSYQGARITKADVLAYQPSTKGVIPLVKASSAIGGSGATQSIPYTGIRKKIGDRLSESVLTKPWAALTIAVDMSKAISWRDSVNEMLTQKVGYNVLIAKASARALQAFPMINSQLTADGSEIVLFEDVNIGVAVNTDRGLMVPVLTNVQSKGISELAVEFSELVERTQQHTNKPNDHAGGTFTISNLGNRGLTSFRAVINPPECAILAVAAIIKTPVVVADEIVIRPMMNLTLSFDHRIVDGDYAAQFLQYLGKLLEDPMRILL